MGIDVAALRHALSAKPFAAREATLLRLVAQAEGIHAQELEMLETAKEATGAFDVKLFDSLELKESLKSYIKEGLSNGLYFCTGHNKSFVHDVAESGRLGRPELVAKRTHIGRV